MVKLIFTTIIFIAFVYNFSVMINSLKDCYETANVISVLVLAIILIKEAFKIGIHL